MYRPQPQSQLPRAMPQQYLRSMMPQCPPQECKVPEPVNNNIVCVPMTQVDGIDLQTFDAKNVQDATAIAERTLGQNRYLCMLYDQTTGKLKLRVNLAGNSSNGVRSNNCTMLYCKQR